MEKEGSDSRLNVQKRGFSDNDRADANLTNNNLQLLNKQNLPKRSMVRAGKEIMSSGLPMQRKLDFNDVLKYGS